MAKDYPVGKAQQMVLSALGLKANGFSEAEQMFQERGLVVVPKREGKTTVPQVTVDSGERGGFNADGEGESWTETYKSVDLGKIAQWIVRR